MFPVSIVLGFIAGLNRDRWGDSLISKVTVAVASLPEFLIAILVVLFIALKLRWLPATSFEVSGSPIDHPSTLVLPILTLALAASAVLHSHHPGLGGEGVGERLRPRRRG